MKSFQPRKSVIAIHIAALIQILCFNRVSAQVLETETARPLKAGEFQIGNAFEYQASSEGKEYAVPFALEYGITKRLSILLEPVAFTQISPKVPTENNPGAIGIGDFEASLGYLINYEKKILPAFTVLGEVKFPTAKNKFIGTGETDYALYLIASKRVHSFDFHGNIIYNINGSPDSVTLKNTWGFNLAGEYFIGEKFEIFGELLGVTSSAGENGGDNQNLPPGQVLTPEAAGGEFSGTLGIAYRYRPGLQFSFGTSYDNNGAFLFRPGITMNFK